MFTGDIVDRGGREAYWDYFFNNPMLQTLLLQPFQATMNTMMPHHLPKPECRILQWFLLQSSKWSNFRFEFKLLFPL
jgi:hypothetical protein